MVNHLINDAKNKPKESWVFYSHSADLGGGELSLLEVVKQSLSEGIRIKVILPREGLLRKRLEALGVTDIQVLSTHAWMTGKFPKLLGVPRLMLIWLEARKFSHFLKTKKPDLLIVNTSIIPGPVFAGNKAHIPTAVFVHEGIRSNKKLKSFLPKSWIIAALKKNADLIVVSSQAIGEEFGGEYIVSAPAIAKPTQVISALVKHHLESPQQPLKAVMLGHISKEKGQLDAIRAIEFVQKQGHHVELALYGDVDPTIEPHLREVLAKSPVKELIKVLPSQLDIDSIFEKTDLTLVLSRYETYGRVAAESIVRAVPVIGLDIPATREMIASGGGLLVSDPVADTAQAIMELLSNAEIYRELVTSCVQKAQAIEANQDQKTLMSGLSALAQIPKAANSL
jgi:glycosyltransferase involved in cell wall biosynthesis